MAVPRACVDVCPGLNKDACYTVVPIPQGAEEGTVFVTVFDVDVVATLQQHLDSLCITSRGREVQWCCAEFTGCDDNRGSCSENQRNGSDIVGFVRVSVEEKYPREGERMDGYVTFGRVTEPERTRGGTEGVDVEEEAEIRGGIDGGDEDGRCEQTSGFAGMGKMEEGEEFG